jgi:hypothetical protein
MIYDKEYWHAVTEKAKQHMMTVPQNIRELLRDWPGRWYAAACPDTARVEGLTIRTYFRGEATELYTCNGARDYYLWSETRQQRLALFKTATEMWAHLAERLEKGPDRFGLVQA